MQIYDRSIIRPISTKVKLRRSVVRESDTMLCYHAVSLSLPNKQTHTHTLLSTQTRLSRVTSANLKQELKDKQGLREAASQQGRLWSVQLTKTLYLSSGSNQSKSS